MTHSNRILFGQYASLVSPAWRMPLFVLIPLLALFCLLAGTPARAGAAAPKRGKTMAVGVARVDITPEESIRLSGYGNRTTKSEGILQRIGAKALAFGEGKDAAVLLTVDLIGLPGHITSRLYKTLHQKIGLDSANLVICTSHTHGGPEVGTLLVTIGEPFPPEQLGQIIRYQQQLLTKLEEVVVQSLKARKPALLAWGQGSVKFSKNRRVIKDGKWVGGGEVDGAPVDHTLPLLRVTDPAGKLQAVLLSYACHATTLGSLNQVHGDWVGEAQKQIESKHPGVTALVAVGCGADITPAPRYKMEHLVQYGKMVADETDRLLASALQPLSSPPVGRYKRVALPFSHIPDVAELVEQAKGEGAKAYYARLALEQIVRGGSIAPALSYPIKTWTFGKDLAMVFLAGEVVVDYVLRLKKELGAERLWVNAYANEVPSYIPSRRILQEGGYEAETSQYSYNRPSPYAPEIEDLIITTVKELLPASFKPKSGRQ